MTAERSSDKTAQKLAETPKIFRSKTKKMDKFSIFSKRIPKTFLWTRKMQFWQKSEKCWLKVQKSYEFYQNFSQNVPLDM